MVNRPFYMNHFLKEMPTSSYMSNYNATGSTAASYGGTHFSAPADLSDFDENEI